MIASRYSYPAVPASVRHIAAAVAALDARDFKGAIAHADEVIRLDPDSPEASEATLLKAHALLRMGRPQEAKKVLLHALDEPLFHHRDAAVALLAEIVRIIG